MSEPARDDLYAFMSERDQLRSELATYRAAVVPVADYNRVCLQRDNALEAVDLLAAELSDARDSATLTRALDVMADVIRHYSRDVESSYSTYEKQGAWRAMVAMMVEAGR
jgi:exonuclease III